ncbi:MAG: hypothetical protein IJ524_02890 [Bacteroidales bacterium]|nr:hypothetical protein [Bacteroidales bacterium]
MKRTIVIMLLLLSALAAQAQEEFEEDSVLISGTVVNRMTGQPEPYTIVRLMQAGALRAAAWCDSTGSFGDLLLPVGGYLLEVQVQGVTLYQADLLLQQDANLSIGVITDTLRMVDLREVRVTALRHLLGSRYIASPDDVRLWNMLYRNGGGSHEAAVAISPDMQPEMDILDLENGVVRTLLPIRTPAKAHKYFTRNAGLKVDATNSDMKNDLLQNGRIRDTKVPAKKE